MRNCRGIRRPTTFARGPGPSCISLQRQSGTRHQLVSAPVRRPRPNEPKVLAGTMPCPECMGHPVIQRHTPNLIRLLNLDDHLFFKARPAPALNCGLCCAVSCLILPCLLPNVPCLSVCLSFVDDLSSEAVAAESSLISLLQVESRFMYPPPFHCTSLDWEEFGLTCIEALRAWLTAG